MYGKSRENTQNPMFGRFEPLNGIFHDNCRLWSQRYNTRDLLSHVWRLNIWSDWYQGTSWRNQSVGLLRRVRSYHFKYHFFIDPNPLSISKSDLCSGVRVPLFIVLYFWYSNKNDWIGQSGPIFCQEISWLMKNSLEKHL